MIGNQETGVPAVWETSRSSQPLDFPSLVLGKLAQTLMTPAGSKERHRHLRDIDALLAPYHDTAYDADLETAAKRRENIEKGHEMGVSRGEAVEMHQTLWIAALMRMMKRRGFLGEEWVRG